MIFRLSLVGLLCWMLRAHPTSGIVVWNVYARNSYCFPAKCWDANANIRARTVIQQQNVPSEKCTCDTHEFVRTHNIHIFTHSPPYCVWCVICVLCGHGWCIRTKHRSTYNSHIFTSSHPFFVIFIRTYYFIAVKVIGTCLSSKRILNALYLAKIVTHRHLYGKSNRECSVELVEWYTRI